MHGELHALRGVLMAALWSVIFKFMEQVAIGDGGERLILSK